jgi:hypothetical protein
MGRKAWSLSGYHPALLYIVYQAILSLARTSALTSHIASSHTSLATLACARPKLLHTCHKNCYTHMFTCSVTDVHTAFSAQTRARTAAFSYVSDTFPYNLIYTDPPLPVRFPSPLHIAGWSELLSQHHDRLFVDTLLHIIQYGARIGYCGPRQSIISSNLTSATADPSTLSLDIARELSHHRILRVPAPDTNSARYSYTFHLLPARPGPQR